MKRQMTHPFLRIQMHLRCRPVCCSRGPATLPGCSAELCHGSRRIFAGPSVLVLLPAPLQFLFSTTRLPEVDLECPCTRCFRQSHSIGEPRAGTLQQKE